MFSLSLCHYDRGVMTRHLLAQSTPCFGSIRSYSGREARQRGSLREFLCVCATRKLKRTNNVAALWQWIANAAPVAFGRALNVSCPYCVESLERAEPADRDSLRALHEARTKIGHVEDENRLLRTEIERLRADRSGILRF